jgi:hypothetical protein
MFVRASAPLPVDYHSFGQQGPRLLPYLWLVIVSGRLPGQAQPDGQSREVRLRPGPLHGALSPPRQLR